MNEKNNIINRIKEVVYFGVCIIPFILILQFFGITCPIKWLTGISCLGCGMTRAWLQVLQGNIGLAFYYHPLWFLIIPALILFVMQDRLNSKIKKICINVGIVIFILVYAYRMTIPQDIVVFSYNDGFIFQIVKTIFNL